MYVGGKETRGVSKFKVFGIFIPSMEVSSILVYFSVNAILHNYVPRVFNVITVSFFTFPFPFFFCHGTRVRRKKRPLEN